MIHRRLSASVRVKHDVTRTTHTLCVHDRGNRIQRWSNIARRVTSINTQSPQRQAQLRKDRCTKWGLNQWTLNACGVPVPLHQRLMNVVSCELYKKKTFRVSGKNYLAYVRKATLDLNEFGHRENGLLSNELQSFEDLSSAKLRWSPATWYCSQEAGLSKTVPRYG